jgi:cytoskeletal protein CcmA (bactofilin family)
VLGEQGEIRGNVVAERVRLSGRIEGAVETGDLALEEGARVKGDVTYGRVRMVKGAVVEGRMSHVAREQPFEQEPAPTGQVPAAPAPPIPGSARKPVYIE